MGLQILWLKRDLRVDDHRALAQAIEHGPVLGLFVFEDGLIEHHDTDAAHLEWQIQSLQELREAFRSRGSEILVRRGEICEVLRDLRRELCFEAIHAHEETGNLWTFARDRRVAEFCRRENVGLHETWQFGVVRKLETRDGWSKLWDARMRSKPIPAPDRIPSPEGLAPDPGAIPSLEDLGVAPTPRTPSHSKADVQTPGEAAGALTLESFLSTRSVNYRADMSTPVAGWEGCSRLSPHLAWGNLSMRRIQHETRARSAELKAQRADGLDFPKTWLPSLSSFQSRLRWHCHFMQKLEDQPDLESVEMNRAYAGIRDDLRSKETLERYRSGQTGYPMVDACMRCLHETGWVNFRMRAMLVSFGTHHLGQPWQDIGRILALLFNDFEPGIHYSQTQMQAGVTGINTVRIYSPIKQVTDQDPEGVFLKRWVPELEGVGKKFLPEPHEMSEAEQSNAGCRIGTDYPEPIVDHKTAYKAARDRIWAVKKTAEAREESQRVYEKHGSRKRPMQRSRSGPKRG
ncbi:MAG: deoxyribodipyrimidine photo-lyase [Planctomycetota bacterium]